MGSPIQVEREAKKSVGTALVVASNFRVVDLLLRAFKDMDVAVTNTVRIRDSMDLIHGRKFEAFALDAELDNEHLDLLAEVRSSSSNNTAVIVSVVPPGPMGETARKSGANFILEQPLTQDTVSRTLKVAYGLIVREYRRYFRCPAKMPITVWSSVTGELQGETVNISEEGMAIRIPYSLGVGTQLLMRLRLPPQTKELVMRAQIIRAANGPVTGIRFVEFSGQAKGQLHEWLSLRLEEIIPSLSKHSA